MKKKKKKLILPDFKNEDEERAFWDKFDLSKYADKKGMAEVFLPNLKPSSESISLRVPRYMLANIKERANAIDVPYQSLIKKYVDEGLSRDRVLSAAGRKG